LPDPGTIDVASLAPYGSPFDDVKKHLSSIAVAEVYVPTAKRVRTWKLENEFFDYGYFLRSVAEALVRESNMPVLTARKADLMGLTDRYVSERLFKGPVDFSQADNYRVLNYVEVFDWTVTVLRRALTELLEKVGYETVASAKWRRISEVGRIQARASALLEVGKCPYPKLGYQARGGGFERDFMAEVLRNSMDVKAFCKLEQRHELSVPYRNEFGILRRYWPDFIVRTADSMYIVETKAERDIVLDSVALKARAGIGWCEAATAVSPPSDVPQPQRWEYVILPEDLFKAARELTFEALVPMCRGRCNAVIANAMGRLF
jgi:type III restriction enzyme